jgi:hypothetical protein
MFHIGILSHFVSRSGKPLRVAMLTRTEIKKREAAIGVDESCFMSRSPVVISYTEQSWASLPWRLLL